MKLTTKQITIIIAGVVIVGTLVVLIVFRPGASPSPPAYKLVVWGIDDRTAFEAGLAKYRAQYPQIEVAYKKIDAENYRAELLNALAAGTGPDVFMIHNRALPKQALTLMPASAEQMNVGRFRELFPTVAEQDFIAGPSVYALPLYLDTLSLLYNRDLFDRAGIVAPPATWAEVQTAASRLRSLDANGQLQRAGAAIGGTAKTVHAAADLLQLLMLQQGTKMLDGQYASAAFSSEKGLAALNFYVQFANNASPFYTWNENQKYDLDAFAAGEVAMVFGYRADLAAIKRKNPFLNVAVAPMPQVRSDERVDWADYWGLVVSRVSKVTTGAWEFARHFTADTEYAKLYADAAGRTPALRSLLGAQIENADTGVFARAALTARSWYQVDEEKIRGIFNSLIEAALRNPSNSFTALRSASDQVTQLMQSARNN